MKPKTAEIIGTVIAVVLIVAFCSLVGLLFRLPQVMTFHDWRCLVVECRLVK